MTLVIFMVMIMKVDQVDNEDHDDAGHAHCCGEDVAQEDRKTFKMAMVKGYTT